MNHQSTEEHSSVLLLADLCRALGKDFQGSGCIVSCVPSSRNLATADALNSWSGNTLFSTSWEENFVSCLLHSQIVDLESALAYTVLVNQTAIHAMPEIIRSTSSALLKAATGQKDASISVTNHPLPTLSHEVSIEVSRETGEGFCSHLPAFPHRLLACLWLTLNIWLYSFCPAYHTKHRED